MNFNLMPLVCERPFLQGPLMFPKSQVMAFQFLHSRLMFFVPLNASRCQALALLGETQALVG